MALIKDHQLFDTKAAPDLTLESDASVSDLDLKGLKAIALTFPNFADGRAYSQARILRNRGFTGEIWATGQVTPDQYTFMLQCGFDVFDVDLTASPLPLWQELAEAVSLTYQRAYTTRAQANIPDQRLK